MAVCREGGDVRACMHSGSSGLTRVLLGIGIPCLSLWHLAFWLLKCVSGWLSDRMTEAESTESTEITENGVTGRRGSEGSERSELGASLLEEGSKTEEKKSK